VSVVAAAGFQAVGVAAGIKGNGALDLALVAAATAVPAAAVFTGNTAPAAPVELSRAHLSRGDGVRAVVLNSGCANAGTGVRGMNDAERMTAATGRRIGCRAREVLVCSTGPIGTALPVDEVAAGIGVAAAELSATPAAAAAAATAILTTDSVPKTVMVQGSGFVIGGMAKGAGMLRPDMATMLAVLTTDAVVGAADLRAALQAATEVTFNALDVDGCESTNDAAIVLASGASGVSPAMDEFSAGLEAACAQLARAMAEDAEGASRVVELRVAGARDDAAARSAGKAIADSALVRASFYGGDPNWGRVLGALGAARIPIDLSRFSVGYDGVVVAAAGISIGADEDALAERLAAGKAIVVDIVVGDGPGTATVVTTDLTPEYVMFNSERS